MSRLIQLATSGSLWVRENPEETGGMDGRRECAQEIGHAYAGRDAAGGGEKLGGHTQR